MRSASPISRHIPARQSSVAYEKAGYSCRYYDIDPIGLRPLYNRNDLDGVSVFSLCGYYGFAGYRRDFIETCRERGITVLQDTTHNPFQPDPQADYIAGSMRKWMGIACGGIAAKRFGSFSVSQLPVDKKHLKGRYAVLSLAKDAAFGNDLETDGEARSLFWRNELELRKNFDAYGSDELSIRILETYPYDLMIARRRENYRLLLGMIKEPRGWSLIFESLADGATPSHLSLYADDRDSFRSFMEERKIGTTVYWPVPPMIGDIADYPGAKWIYKHICSIQIDQRYGGFDMLELAAALNEYSKTAD